MNIEISTLIVQLIFNTEYITLIIHLDMITATTSGCESRSVDVNTETAALIVHLDVIPETTTLIIHLDVTIYAIRING